MNVIGSKDLQRTRDRFSYEKTSEINGGRRGGQEKHLASAGYHTYVGTIGHIIASYVSNVDPVLCEHNY